MKTRMQFRALQQWPRAFTKSRRRSTFHASYSRTLSDLDRELAAVGATEVVIELAVTASQILQDGSRPYADARPSHPGVIISFSTKKTGPVRMPCDTFAEWQDNLRAIALALDALRRVDRYGVTSHAEQYKGWSQLPPPGGGIVTPPPMNVEGAAAFLSRHSDCKNPSRIQTDEDFFRSAYRQAAFKFHPDTNGGSHLEEWSMLQVAEAVLAKHHGI